MLAIVKKEQLSHPKMPLTNNEAMVAAASIQRKISYGTTSNAGDQF
ncbi:hypothetical protein I3X05_18615 [Vibrio navarrensis]|uniref:Uncharacterized protein n=1 Tax=Vibrio navarrensis TaxID=29495 RepID=A0AAJ4IFW8_9VIBR|nr:hypothetical protein I3X05_18615 [Vibrio navarrensis]